MHTSTQFIKITIITSLILFTGCDSDNIKKTTENFINDIIPKAKNKISHKLKTNGIDSFLKKDITLEKITYPNPPENNSSNKSYIFPIDLDQIYSSSKCSKYIHKSMYDTCYSYKYKSTIFDSFMLDGELVDKKNIKKRPNFYPSPEIPKKYRSVYRDFSGNDIDRGHLRSDASTDWEHIYLKQTYSLMNVVPQYSVLNRKMWIKAEKYSRMVARKLGRAYVINIILFDNKPKRIGKNHIAIPSGFYKIIYNNEKHMEHIFRKCFYYQNKQYSYEFAKQDTLRNHVVDCSKIAF